MNGENKTQNQGSAISQTAAQRSAIAHRCGEMVVLAGAGSGKTATLANRCAELVTDSQDACDVRELLVLTFTREAADEMRSRIARAIRAVADGRADHLRSEWLSQQAALADTAQISTFHSFCNWVAKTWFMFCHVDPGFTLLNEHEAAMMQTDAIQEAARTFMAPDHPQHDGFIEVFDLYAGAALAQLETLIWPVLRTMESVVDPEDWCRRAANAGDTEITTVISTFIERKVQHLEELALMLLANAQEAQLFDADAKKLMYNGLLEAGNAAKNAAQLLQEHGAAGWSDAGKLLANVSFAPAIRLTDNTPDHAEAKHFKNGIYAPVKEAFLDLCEELNTSNIVQLTAIENTSRRRIATILAFAACVQQHYQQTKQSRNQLDYSDLERTVLAALSTPENPLKAILHQRFRHILVDEYQDINPVQERLIELLYRGDQPPEALKPGSLFGVGDVLQSIYGFRGSEPRILYDKVKDLRLSGQSAGIITMRDNFRTLPPLIDALNAILLPMLQMVQRDSRGNGIPMAELAELHHGRAAIGHDAYPGIPVQLHVLTESQQDASVEGDSDGGQAAASPDMDDSMAELRADELEATRIGQLIHELLQSKRTVGPHCRPMELKDIAILLRAPSQRAPHYVRILRSMGIAANAALTTGFFESSEVLEVLDILKVLDNPTQDIALAGVLLGPIGGCTAAELSLIRKAGTRHTAFHQIVAALHLRESLDDATRLVKTKIIRTLAKLEYWRAAMRSDTLANGLARILQEAGLLNRAAAMPGGQQRLANLRLLQYRAMEFSGFESQSLSRFLNFFERLREERDLGEAAPPAGNAVRIMSIHGSKGLEFPVVFVAALGTAFNRRDLQQRLLVDRDKGIGMKVLDDNGVMVHDSPGRKNLAEEKWGQLLQEEARLLYVAMTRARDQLILVGRATESAMKKWRQVRLPDAAASDKQPQAITSPRCPLDYLGPIFSQYQDRLAAPPLLILHEIPESQLLSPEADRTTVAQSADRAAGGLATNDGPANEGRSEEVLNAMFHRITRPYPYGQLTTMPAVTSVSRLKSLMYDDRESPASIMDATPNTIRLDMTEESSGIKTGLIMHRVMQRLDFQHTASESQLRTALAALVAQGYLSAEEMAFVDQQALLWLFSTPLGDRMRKAAAHNRTDHQILRELSFLWSIPAAEAAQKSPAANPGMVNSTKEGTPGASGIDSSERILIRGTIDALLIEPDQIEIIDYKTDAATFIAARLPAYRQQVNYYAHAAEHILKKPVRRTSLVFFSARQIQCGE